MDISFKDDVTVILLFVLPSWLQEYSTQTDSQHRKAFNGQETTRNIEMKRETNPCCRLCVSVAKMLNKAGSPPFLWEVQKIINSNSTVDVFCPNVCLPS